MPSIPATISFLTCHAYGVPADAAEVAHQPCPVPGAGQVLVRTLFAAINPADLNVLEGSYPLRPAFGAALGHEGVGEVLALGAGVTGLNVGQRVIAPGHTGWWSEALVLPATALIVVPAEIPLEQAAMLAVNPATAWHMLHRVVPLHQGDWVLQNAANSMVGRWLIALARAGGWHTLNVVRRAELAPELTALGADVVVTDDPPWSARAADLLRGGHAPLACNAVGGASAKELAKALSPGGTLVTYGAMGRQSVEASNPLLIFKDIRYRGFWITAWYRHASPAEIRQVFAALLPVAQAGRVAVPIAAVYPLAAYRTAFAHAATAARGGKVLLQLA